MPVEIQTPDDPEYKFYPVNGTYFTFKVRAANDAHLALVTTPTDADSHPIIEIFIGASSNTKSIIRKNFEKDIAVEVDTSDILSPKEFRGFWIQWDKGIVKVGHEDDDIPFMSYKDPKLEPINYVGVCTGWGSTGSWIIEDSLCRAPGFSPAFNPAGWPDPTCTRSPGVWVPARRGQIPPEAVPGGFDGDTLYIARAKHRNALTPGKLLPAHHVIYLPWGGAEHSYEEYEVLCGVHGNWQATSGANIPPNLVPAGETENGEPLYIGRANHNGIITIGKVQPSHAVCYISYGGREIAYRDYEIFVPN